MPNLTAEIDRLYQLPLGEFTAARDALAKTAGKDKAAVKALEKPNAPAWAVNQLYWHHRGVFDRLVAAAERLRAEHGKLFSGAKADVAAAEAAHGTAVATAMDRVREIVRDAGETASPATLAAASETLRALRRDSMTGRLTRPLKLSGFEALDGLVGTMRPRPASSKQPAPKPSAKSAALAPPPKVDKRAEKERAKQAASLRADVAAAHAAMRAAEGAVAQSRRAIAAAEKTRADLDRKIEASVATLKQLRDAAVAGERLVSERTAEHARLEMRLRALGQP